MDKSARDRILQTAAALFYRQGYLGTGVNQLIAEARVAKASFFHHFPTKEVLLLTYARALLQQDEQLRQAVESWKNPLDRFFAAFRILNPWLKSTGFRGCPFQNLSRETLPQTPALQPIVLEHHANLLGLFGDVARHLSQHDEHYAGLDIEKTAAFYHVLFEGAISTAAATRSAHPVDTAVSAMLHYLRSPAG